jgi:hypothetical protein
VCAAARHHSVFHAILVSGKASECWQMPLVRLWGRWILTCIVYVGCHSMSVAPIAKWLVLVPTTLHPRVRSPPSRCFFQTLFQSTPDDFPNISGRFPKNTNRCSRLQIHLTISQSSLAEFPKLQIVVRDSTFTPEWRTNHAKVRDTELKNRTPDRTFKHLPPKVRVQSQVRDAKDRSFNPLPQSPSAIQSPNTATKRRWGEK